MNNVFASSSSVLSAKTPERQSGRKEELLETGEKTLQILKLGAGCCCAFPPGSTGVVAGGMRLVGTGAVVLAFASHHTIPLPIFLLVFRKQVGFCCHGRQGGYNGRSCAPAAARSPPLCPAQPPPITSAADITQLARRWHFASWANIVSASSKSGSHEKKRKIWTKRAVGKSVPSRPSPCLALCVQTDLMPCRKAVPLPRGQGEHKQLAQIWQSKVLQWVLKWGRRGLPTSDPPLSAAVIPGELLPLLQSHSAASHGRRCPPTRSTNK